MESRFTAIKAAARGLILLIFPFLCHYAAYAATSEFIITSPAPESYKALDILVTESTLDTTSYFYLTLPTIEFEYGLLPNLEVDLTLTYVFYRQYHPARQTHGIGDTSLSATYCFLHESTYLPQTSFEPTYSFPTGNVREALGNGKPLLYFPLYAQKTWGKWVLTTGIGYTYNSAPSTLNYFYGGVRVSHQLTDKLLVGIEIYQQGATSSANSSSNSNSNSASAKKIQQVYTPSGAYTELNAGAEYHLIKNLTLELSAGKSFVGSNVLTTYLGLDFTV